MNVNKLSCGVFLGVWLGIVAPSFGLDNSNVLVLYNSASPDGAQIASYYSQIHPGVTELALTGVPTTEDTTWDVYLNTIRPQVLSALTSSIDCIVTTKGLPLRINNPKVGSGAWNVYSSLESELTRVDAISTRQLMGNQAYWSNPLALNPYFYNERVFNYSTYGIRLTSRLDGFSVSDVTAAIDRARNAVVGRPGYTFLIDDDPCAAAHRPTKWKALSTPCWPRGAFRTFTIRPPPSSAMPAGR